MSNVCYLCLFVVQYVSYNRQDLLPFRDHMCSPSVLVVSVLIIMLYCVAFCIVCLRRVVCVPKVASVCLILSLIFSNVYL